MSAELRWKDPVSLAQMPVQERVCDLLGDLLLSADDVLTALRDQEAKEIRWLEPTMRSVFNDISSAMMKLAD